MRYAFASREWLAALHAVIAVRLEAAGEAARGLAYSMCEVYRGVPAHLGPDADGTLAWHCRIADGALEFGLGELPGADLKVAGTYEALLPIARIDASSGPEAAKRLAALAGAAMASGTLAIEGDLAARPAPLLAVHDAIARLTA
ncbi:MAG: hypothetical protein H6923_08870 [Alphaproteobacteria bacterium]|nr:hypothetical protein [Alphaproteobacteria bacterium]